MKIQSLLLLSLLLFLPSEAKAQSSVRICNTATPQDCAAITGSALAVSGTFSASLGGFTPSAAGARMTPLSVTTSDSSGNLPTGAVVVVSNVGTTNPMYCNVNGIAATTSDQLIGANSWFGFTIPAAVTTLHCIATGGTTTANGVGGAGLPTGAGGGSAGGGGGGGAVTVADGADVTQGAIGDAAASAGGTGTLSAKLRETTALLNTINTTLGTPMQTTGGSVAVTQTTSPWIVAGGGTAGTAATGVVSVQGIASMTPLFITSATAPIVSMNSASANAGVTSPIAGVFDDAAPTSITENSFGFLRMSANRNAYQTIRDAAGNERGVNVNASNQLSVSCDNGCAGGTFNNNADAVATSSSNGQAAAWNYVYNGTTFDRMRGTTFGTYTIPGQTTTTLSAWTSGTSLNATQVVMASKNGAPSILVQLVQTTTLTAGAVTFEGTYDGTFTDGVSGAAVPVPAGQVINPATYAPITNPYTFVASTNQPIMILTQGFLAVRMRLSTVITGSGSVAPTVTLLPYNPTVSALLNPLATGTAVIGKVGIDQTTPGTTNLVAITPAQAGVGATGSAPPANANYLGANASGATGGLMAGVIQCDQSALYDASTNGRTQLVALTSGRTIYVCGYAILAAGTVNVNLVYGTGSVCGTGTTAITPAYQLTAQVGIVDKSPFFSGLKTASANALCINTSGGVAVQAMVYYAVL